jgi:hypothetical protein
MLKYMNKINKSTINTSQYLSRISNYNTEHHKKVQEKSLAKRIKDADENALMGKFMLPHAKG